jgi:addiction module HigA family antidote
VHPGEVLVKEFLKPLGLSEDDLASATGLAADTVRALSLGQTNVTPDMASRLATYFNTSTRLWLGLQSEFERDLAQGEDT